MRFRSRYTNHMLAVPTSSGHKTVTFVDGVLDTAHAAKQTGLPEEVIIEAVRSNRYYGVDFTEDEPVPAPRKR